MKTLILVRHGKSSWDYAVNDKDRPLQERGIKDVHLVSNTFKTDKMAIDAAFSSPANRALHTCMIFLRQIDFPLNKLKVTTELYDFSGNSVLNFIKNFDNNLKTVLVFGHNEAFTNLANSLGNTYIDNVPTSGLVHLSFEVDNWQAVKKGTTKQTIFPKELK